ncbi:hypothetical protein ACIA49_22245 [Kribbella sp. NPDC051587]|uniref:hypothetical protein n=1 Tax=Kribbella sp. NPDC051587 TaxID=3364119 RepID=UPI0037925B99
MATAPKSRLLAVPFLVVGAAGVLSFLVFAVGLIGAGLASGSLPGWGKIALVGFLICLALLVLSTVVSAVLERVVHSRRG